LKCFEKVRRKLWSAFEKCKYNFPIYGIRTNAYLISTKLAITTYVFTTQGFLPNTTSHWLSIFYL